MCHLAGKWETWASSSRLSYNGRPDRTRCDTVAATSESRSNSGKVQCFCQASSDVTRREKLARSCDSGQALLAQAWRNQLTSSWAP